MKPVGRNSQSTAYCEISTFSLFTENDHFNGFGLSMRFANEIERMNMPAG